MEQFLRKLKTFYNIDSSTILDIGAYHGTWSELAAKFYPLSKYILIEPIPYDELNHLKLNAQVFNKLLWSKNEMVNWYELRNTGDSIFKERNAFTGCTPVKKQAVTVDSLNIQDAINIVKLDTQGTELSILEGGKETFKNVQVIILETPFFGQYNEDCPSFLDYIKYMDTYGFTVLEIVDIHKIKNYHMQLDIAFIKKEHEICDRVDNEFPRS